MKNSMGYLRLLLVLTISMCIDKNLASSDVSELNDLLKTKVIKTDEERLEEIGLVFKFFHMNCWGDRLFWVLGNVSFDFGVGREKDNWDWERYWGRGGCGLILYPDVYKSKWLKIGFLFFRYNFIGRIALLLRSILGYSEPAGYVGEKYWRNVFLSGFLASFFPECSILYFKFFGFFSVGLFDLDSLFLIKSAFDPEMGFFFLASCKFFVAALTKKDSGKFRRKYCSDKSRFWNLKLVIDFAELFKIFNKEESDPQF